MKNKGCLVAFLIVIAIVASFAFALKRALTPRDLSKEDPRKVFESFVCSPIPPSIHELKTSGVIAFAGGGVFMEFQFAPLDHDDLISKGRFQLADDKSSPWIKDFQPDGVTGDILRYVRVNKGMTETALFITEDRRRAWFREIHF